jgi:hypothetical protein
MPAGMSGAGPQAVDPAEVHVDRLSRSTSGAFCLNAQVLAGSIMA